MRLSLSDFWGWFRHEKTFNPPGLALISEQPSGDVTDLETYRAELVENRIEILDKSGLYLDRSPTGAGKSFADAEAFRRALKSLCVLPTHKDCRKLADRLGVQGLDAEAYPGRMTRGDETNCWNLDADLAQALSLSPAAAVCICCQHFDKCNREGYLGQLQVAETSQIVVATHARATHRGLGGLADGRDFVSIHEKVCDVVLPTTSLPLASLQAMREVLDRMLNEPRWLDWLGNSERRHDDGRIVQDNKKKLRRDAIERSLRELLELAEDVTSQAERAATHCRLQELTTVEIPPGVEAALFRASKDESSLRRAQLKWSPLLRMARGDYMSAGVVVAQDAKSICLVRSNLPSGSATVLLSDSTADKVLLETGLNQEIKEVTPEGRLEFRHKVIQFPNDITRDSSISSLNGLLRAVCVRFSKAKRIGVITHKNLIDQGIQLGELFDHRIPKVSYFGSGDDRSSNDWIDDGCDLIVIAGTPRVPEEIIVTTLMQCGMAVALLRSGDWSELYWQGISPSGRKPVVSDRGYRDPDWRRAHRTHVRAAIIQAVGRGRGLLENGCDVVVLSNEEAGFPVADVGADLHPISASQADVLSAVVALIDLRNNRRCALTREIAEHCNLSDRQVREHLGHLEQQGLILRVGERGGWRLSDDLEEIAIKAGLLSR